MKTILSRMPDNVCRSSGRRNSAVLCHFCFDMVDDNIDFIITSYGMSDDAFLPNIQCVRAGQSSSTFKLYNGGVPQGFVHVRFCSRVTLAISILRQLLHLLAALRSRHTVAAHIDFL